MCSGDVDDRHSTGHSDALLKKLVEAEVDGQSIADQAAGFTDVIQRLRDVRLSSLLAAIRLDESGFGFGECIRDARV